MPTLTKRLKKELRLFDVYAIAMGATISTGFFLLPGLAFAQAGPALILSYLVSALLVVPPMLCMVELATAMPKAGGAYYFLDRSMGPMIGTIGGLGTWIVLILKSAFALIGMGAYLNLLLPDFPIVPLAVGLTVLLGIVNLFGAKKTGLFQIGLIFVLLVVLLWFVAVGVPAVDTENFSGFFDAGFNSILATAGLIYISFAGLTKVTGVAEEVADPEKNLARGMFLALGTAVALYAIGTFIMVGVVPAERLSGDLTSVASTVEYITGEWGVIVVIVAAVMAFFAAANAAIMSASRYPMAMSRDHLLPTFFRKLSKGGIPSISIYVTVGLTIFSIVALDPMKIAKLAGAFQLVMFALICLATIVMRESGIESYDPGYRSPFYPWTQIAGIIAPLMILAYMGSLSILFTIGLVVFCLIWYAKYARRRVSREGAVYHMFARLGRYRYDALDAELRGILKEKGLREEDPFDEVVTRAFVIDHDDDAPFDELVDEASVHFSTRMKHTAGEIASAFMQGTRIGATPVTHGVALPHIWLDTIEHPELVIVRSRQGVLVTGGIPGDDGDEEVTDLVNALFFLASPEGDPGQHLRILAQIAGRVDEEGFMDDWLAAEDEQALKETLLREERYVSFQVVAEGPTAQLVGRQIKSVDWPEGSLVALVRRNGGTIIPKGSTELQEGDRVTVLGEPESIRLIHSAYEV